jgi:hypothetical protein
MTPAPEDRAEFERWAKANTADWMWGERELAWASWQAATTTSHAAGYRAGIEDAAKVVEDNQQSYSGSSGAYLSPRSRGNQDGLTYATAIRSLLPKES